MRFLSIPACLLFAALSAFSQNATPELLKNLKWRNIGLANMMGRVADVEGVPGKPEIVYVGSASGGIWKTTDAGVSWKPIFDEMDYHLHVSKHEGSLESDSFHRPGRDAIWIRHYVQPQAVGSSPRQ